MTKFESNESSKAFSVLEKQAEYIDHLHNHLQLCHTFWKKKKKKPVLPQLLSLAIPDIK